MAGLLGSAVVRLAASVDHLVYRTALARGERSRRGSSAESLGHGPRMEGLTRIRAAYAPFDEQTLFPEPDLPPVELTRVKTFGRGGEVLDLTWRSDFHPLLPDLEARYGRYVENGRARARLFTIPGASRPAVMVLHGYLGGQTAIEERFWPIRALLRRGFDVALAVLPGHGLRRDSPRQRPFFPGSDPRITIEGFRQAMLDLRALSRILEARGAPRVGVMGMSLGGYTAALLATVEPRLAFSIPVVPLASIADFARDGGRLVGDEAERQLQHAALESAHQVVSPLARPSRIDPSRIVVVAGEADRITPSAHADKLAAHLGARTVMFPGAHLVQAGRPEALERALSLVTET